MSEATDAQRADLLKAQERLRNIEAEIEIEERQMEGLVLEMWEHNDNEILAVQRAAKYTKDERAKKEAIKEAR